MEVSGIVLGLTMEILELVVIVGVPLALGLLWNQWAGGASGFLMGTFYALYWANSFHGIAGSGTVLLAYIVSPMLIGYMAGALNKRSDNFKRLLISGFVACYNWRHSNVYYIPNVSCKRCHRNNWICIDRLGTYACRCTDRCCGQSFLLVRHGKLANTQIFLNPLLFLGTILSQISCDKKTCINYKEGHCSLTNPEKVGNACLDFEDAMDALRLKADAIKGTLG